jgi:type I restriction enzyme, S subunit
MSNKAGLSDDADMVQGSVAEVCEPSAKYLVKTKLKKTEAGLIPCDWDFVRLTQVAEVRGGVAKNANVAIADPIEVAYLRVANVQDGYLDLADVSAIRISKSDLKRYSLMPGDVLMNEGGDLDKLGRGAVWRGQITQCVHQNHVFAVRCGPQLNSEYLNVWTGTTSARRFFLLAGKQTTNLASISKSSLGEMPIGLPQPAEQRAIATALSDIDALIAGLERLIAKKRDIKQAAMQQLLTGQTRLPGFSGAWERKLLGGVCTITTGKKDVNEGDPNGQFPFFTCSRTHTFSQAYSFDTEAILIAGNGDVGNLHYFNGKFEAYQRTYVLFDFSVHVGFLWQQLSDRLAESLGLGKIGSSIPYIKKENLTNFEFFCPQDPAEQTAVATTLSEMDADLAAIESRLAKTRAVKQGMMQELLTGRIRLV